MNISQDKNKITDLAMQLQELSGFHLLTAEQSWHQSEHLTPLQMRQFHASQALFTLTSHMEK